jgi:hypothetical protein
MVHVTWGYSVSKSRFELWGHRIRLPQSQLTFPNREPNPHHPQKLPVHATGIATLEIGRKKPQRMLWLSFFG